MAQRTAVLELLQRRRQGLGIGFATIFSHAQQPLGLSQVLCQVCRQHARPGIAA